MNSLKSFILAVFIFPGAMRAAELARVGDTVITTEQFQAALKALGQQGQTVAANPELRKRFLDHMVNSQLVAAKARSDGFEKDELYRARLADVTNQLLAGEYVDRTLDKKMTDGAIRQFFTEHKTEFSKKEVRASHIVLATEEEAKNALAEVSKANADFEKIAKERSKDKTIDLGFFPRGRMTPEIEKAAFATAKGSLYKAPVHSMFGWHVIKVTDQRGDDQVDFAKVKDEVRAKFRASLQEEMVHSLRDKTKVAINEQELKNFKLAQ